jgi:hypothetical protein
VGWGTALCTALVVEVDWRLHRSYLKMQCMLTRFLSWVFSCCCVITGLSGIAALAAWHKGGVAGSPTAAYTKPRCMSPGCLVCLDSVWYVLSTRDEVDYVFVTNCVVTLCQ